MSHMKPFIANVCTGCPGCQRMRSGQANSVEVLRDCLAAALDTMAVIDDDSQTTQDLICSGDRGDATPDERELWIEQLILQRDKILKRQAERHDCKLKAVRSARSANDL